MLATAPHISPTHAVRRKTYPDLILCRILGDLQQVIIVRWSILSRCSARGAGLIATHTLWDRVREGDNVPIKGFSPIPGSWKREPAGDLEAGNRIKDLQVGNLCVLLSGLASWRERTMAAATPRLVTRLPVALPTSSHRVPRRQSIRAPCSACLARRRHCSRPLQGETLRCYAATATATAALPDTLDLSLLPSDLAPSNLSVEGKGRVVPVLREIRLLLEDEIGGSEEWIRRVDAALTDLGQRRHGRIAGDQLVPLSLIG